jgi:hypothetical protein
VEYEQPDVFLLSLDCNFFGRIFVDATHNACPKEVPHKQEYDLDPKGSWVRYQFRHVRQISRNQSVKENDYNYPSCWGQCTALGATSETKDGSDTQKRDWERILQTYTCRRC